MNVNNGNTAPKAGNQVAGDFITRVFNGQKLPRIDAAIKCSTINDVIDLIPQEYQAALWPCFLKLADNTIQYQEINCLLGRLQKSIDIEKPLLYLRSYKLPAIQFLKEASNTVHVQTAIGKMKNLHKTYLGEVAGSIKSAKELESSYYGNLITPKVYVPAITQVVQAVYNKLEEMNKVPDVSKDKNSDLTFSENSIIPQHVVAWHSALLHELPVLGTCIITLACAKVNAKQQCTDQKKVVKRVTDAEAETLRLNKVSISKMVQNTVQNQLKN
jgi:hypothetical protein